MTEQKRVLSGILAVVGAAAGGALGLFGFKYALEHGFYALILPGGLLGLGCGLLAGHPSRPRGFACAAAAAALGLFAEWNYRPFHADPSLSYFLTHLQNLEAPLITLGMIAVGTVIAYWLGKDASFRRS